MFRGATLVNLDSKGRLSVPTRYREQLLENAAGQMVCTIDIHHPCLLLYPLPEWEIIEQKLSRLSSMNPVSISTAKGAYQCLPVTGNSCLRTLPVKWFAPLTFITRACCFTPCLNGILSSKNYRVCRARTRLSAV